MIKITSIKNSRIFALSALIASVSLLLLAISSFSHPIVTEHKEYQLFPGSPAHLLNKHTGQLYELKQKPNGNQYWEQTAEKPN